MKKTHKIIHVESLKMVRTPLLNPTPSSSFVKTLALATLICTATALLSITLYYQAAAGSLSGVCQNAPDTHSCSAIVAQLLATSLNSRVTDDNIAHLLKLLLRKSELEVRRVMHKTNHLKNRINDNHAAAIFDDCAHLMTISAHWIADSIEAIERNTAASHFDAHTWLSGVLTNHVTCIDSLQTLNSGGIDRDLQILVSQSSTALAILVALSVQTKPQILDQITSRLEFPSWMSIKDRKLLTSPSLEVKVDANVVVAKDGSGKYKTVNEAVAAAPSKSATRYVIYIKKGTYKENVVIASGKKNIVT